MSTCFFFALFSIFALILLVHAQDQSGFISIDCGSSSSYTDTTTGINYVTDATFIDTGVSKSISADYRIDRNAQLLWTLRSFPEGIRNCYNVRVKRGNRYLIRATFLYGNYDGKGEVPQFDLHLGANMWDSVELHNESSILLKEIVHMPSSNYIYVCLVNMGLGTPLISGLEFRLLKNTTYVTQTGSLANLGRLDVASTTNQTVRFKEDVYDRIWKPYHDPEWAELTTTQTIDARNSNDFQPPPIIMRTASTPKNENGQLDFEITLDSSVKMYVYMHFAELVELQANQSRSFNISVNGIHLYGPLVPDYLYTTTIYTTSALSGGDYKFSIYKTENSTLPPIINAIEFFTVKELFQSETVQKDVDSVLKIKSTYGVKKDWQGDPCAPQAYMWDGLNCSYNAFDPPRIISLNLTSSGLSGEIPPYLSNLTMLQSLDLSNNNLTGPVPEFLAQLPSLTVLNLQGNMLTGSVPAELIKRSNDGLLSLSVGGNPNLCSSISCNKKKNSVVVPIVASVATLSILIVAMAIFLGLKRRKQRVGKVDAKSNKTSESLESKNRRFTYSEILRITNNLETVIGVGGFGKVYLGYLEDNEVAVKILSLSSRQGYSQFVAEVKHLMRVHHRNLTTLVGYCDEDDTKIGLIYEYMANGNLAEHLSDRSTSILSWEGRLRIAMEAGQGLEYLHSGCKPPIVHRDVKTTNILLNDKFQAKLADFGLSKSFPIEGGSSSHVSHVSTVVAGTPGYLDPEYYVTGWLSDKSDVFSFGVVLLEIITCRPVIANIGENNHISKWVSNMLTSGDIKSIVDPRLQGDFDTNSVWKAVEIAMACVSQSSTRRPTMNHIVMELKDCLGMELVRRRNGHGTESQDSYETFTVNINTELAPLAR